MREGYRLSRSAWGRPARSSPPKSVRSVQHLRQGLRLLNADATPMLLFSHAAQMIRDGLCRGCPSDAAGAHAPRRAIAYAALLCCLVSAQCSCTPRR